MVVEPGGPSDKAGLRAGTRQTDVLLRFDFGQPVYLAAGGDLIVAIDDQPVKNFDDVLVYLERYTSPDLTHPPYSGMRPPRALSPVPRAH